MSENIEVKMKPQEQASQPTAEPLTSQGQLPEAQEQSWGEKYKVKTYHFIRNTLVNYIINFMAAASFTYAFDVKLGSWYQDKIVTPFIKDSRNPELKKFVINFMTKTQLLLCGGHILQPLLKWMKDNRKRLEFRIGHGLDLLQEMVGRGNAASKSSLEEYNRVSELVAIGDYNHKQRDALPAPELTEDDKKLLAKHQVNEELQFTDKKQSWARVIKARLTGVLCTTLLSAGLALTKSDTIPPKFYDFRNRYEKPLGVLLGNNVIKYIPGINWLFNHPKPIRDSLVTGHQLIGEYFIDDAIYTAASKLGFDKMERYIDKKEAEREKAEKKEEKQEERISAAVTARNKKVKEGVKTFSAREKENQNNGANMALAPA